MTFLPTSIKATTASNPTQTKTQAFNANDGRGGRFCKRRRVSDEGGGGDDAMDTDDISPKNIPAPSAASATQRRQQDTQPEYCYRCSCYYCACQMIALGSNHVFTSA